MLKKTKKKRKNKLKKKNRKNATKKRQLRIKTTKYNKKGEAIKGVGERGGGAHRKKLNNVFV